MFFTYYICFSHSSSPILLYHGPLYLSTVYTRISINRIYEDNVNGKLSDERFAKMSASYESEQAELTDTIKTISESLNNDKTEQDNIRRFVSVAKKYTELTELSTEILHDFIQKIVVHAPDKSSGKRVVQIDIYYNFIGKING